MAAEAICDWCSRRETMWSGDDHNYHKPRTWLQRHTKDGIILACCNDCKMALSTMLGTVETTNKVVEGEEPSSLMSGEVSVTDPH